MKKKIRWSKQNFDRKDFDKKIKVGTQGDDFGEDEEIQLPTLINTPMGVFNVDNRYNPYSMFKIWMGNTNFAITPSVKNMIKSVRGVEGLKIITRYRFLIAIGELFDENKVKEEVVRQVCGNDFQIVDDKLYHTVELLANQISRKYKYYGIYVFPNGEIESCSTNVFNKEFEQKLELLSECQQLSNGVLITSIDGV